MAWGRAESVRVCGASVCTRKHLSRPSLAWHSIKLATPSIAFEFHVPRTLESTASLTAYDVARIGNPALTRVASTASCRTPPRRRERRGSALWRKMRRTAMCTSPSALSATRMTALTWATWQGLHCSAQPEPFLTLKLRISLKPQNMSLEKCSHPAEKWTSVCP